MKNIKNSLIALFGILAISACTTEDVQDRPIIQGIDSPMLTAPDDASTYTLLPENMTQQAERFVWSAANYNGDVAVGYTLEIDVEGGDFSAPQSLGGTNGALQLSVAVETLNNACLALGALPYTAASFDVRIVSSASGFDMMASNTLTITVNPYTTETPKLWVVGGFQNDSGYGSDWTHATAPQLASEAYGNTNFEGYIYFATDQFFGPAPNDGKGFKFSTQANWNGTNYTDDGSFSGALSSTASDNISISAGYYKINANTTSLTYSTTLTNWGVTGSGTPNGWPDNGVVDHNMTYNSTSKKWEIILTLSAGGNEIKFRANDDWGLNYGDTGADGSLNEGGDNIVVPAAGNYLIELDLSNPRAYTYTLTPQ